MNMGAEEVITMVDSQLEQDNFEDLDHREKDLYFTSLDEEAESFSPEGNTEEDINFSEIRADMLQNLRSEVKDEDLI